MADNTPDWAVDTSAASASTTAAPDWATAPDWAKPEAAPKPVEPTGNMLTDVWPEIKQAATTAAGTIADTLNPFSEARHQAYAKAAAEPTFLSGLGDIASQTLETGKGIAAVPELATAPITGAARSLIGHPYSTLTGIPYKEAKSDVDLAMMGLAPGRGGLRTVAKSAPPAPVPILPTPSGPLGVTLSKGQETGELPLIQKEQAALRGTIGEAAQARAQEFANQQQAQVAAARSNVSAQLDPFKQQLVETPHDAADVVANALADQQRLETGALQQRSAQLQAAHEDLRSSLSPTNSVLASNPLDAANIISGSVGKAAEDAQVATNVAYSVLRELPGNFHPAAFNKIGEKITAKLNQGSNPIRISPEITPQANAAINDLDDLLGGIKQIRDPDTGQILPREPITPQVVEETRKRLNSFYGDALQTARSSNNWSDVRAMRGVMDAFDGQVTDRLKKGTFIGGDPADVIDSMQYARAKHAEYRKTFTPQGPGDVVGPAIQQIVGRFEGQAATPEQISNMLYGKGPLPVKIAGRLLQVFGENSPEIGAVRQGLLSYITERPAGAAAWGPEQVADRIDAFTSGPGRTLIQTYLRPNEISKLRALGAQLRQHGAELNAPVDPVDATFARITGTDGVPAASTQDAVNLLFKRTLTGDRYSVELAQRLKDKLGASSPQFSAYKQGLFHYAVQPGEGLVDWGPKKVADNLNKLLNVTGRAGAGVIYSPQERALIHSYADLMRKLEVPQAGANWSNTATFMQGLLHRMSGWLGTVAGAALARTALPFLPWGVSEVIGGAAAVEAQKLVKALDARKVAQQMPLIAEQMEKYQKALKIYNKANTPLSRAAIGFAGTNLSRALAPLGAKLENFATGPGPQLPGTSTAAPGQDQQSTPNRADGGGAQLFEDEVPSSGVLPPPEGDLRYTKEGYPYYQAPEAPGKLEGSVSAPETSLPASTPNTPTPDLPTDYGLWSAPGVGDVPDLTQSTGSITLDKLIGAGGQERYQTWPEKLIRSGTTLPGDVYSGKTPVVDPETGHTSEEVIQRAQDVAGLMGGTSIPAAERGALGAVGGKPFYSAVEQAIANAPQQKMHGSQWLGWLKNQPGVKAEELSHLGLDSPDALPAGVVTKDQVLTHVKDNSVPLQEIEKRGEPISEDNIGDIAEARLQGDRPDLVPETNAYNRELENYANDVREEMKNNGGTPRHAEWQLPGGENYRELLLTLPTPNWYYPGRMDAPSREAAAQLFRSSHWDEPNVVAHLRMNDRDIPDVGKSLHLEELQSDWGQKGRREGFKNPNAPDAANLERTTNVLRQKLEASVGESLGDKAPTFRKVREEVEALIDAVDVGEGDTSRLSWKPTAEQLQLTRDYNAAWDKYRTAVTENQGVPNFPFKTTWPDLLLKRAITKAAREGYDAISWTPGEQQAARYDLSKQVDKIYAAKNKDGTFDIAATPKGSQTPQKLANTVTKDKLADYVGKDLAEKISAQTQSEKAYEGGDLKVGGEGMKSFYDSMLPNIANKLGKKYGAKVEWKPYSVREKGSARSDYYTVQVPVLRLTPKLKEQALKQGLPMFKRGGAVKAQSNQQHIPGPITQQHHQDKPAYPQNRAHGGRVNPDNINHFPTEGQKRSGTYAKDHVNIHGLNITIENARGSKRHGVDKNGTKWTAVLPAHYGYLKKTEGADHDHLDVYLGPHMKSKHVYLIDQIDAETGKYDEAKIFIGAANLQQALRLYKSAFSDGKGGARIGAVHSMTIGEFKTWLEHGNTKAPFKPVTLSKISHTAASYAPKAKDMSHRCANCTRFIPAQHGGPDCILVAKPISPQGWCKHFRGVRK